MVEERSYACRVSGLLELSITAETSLREYMAVLMASPWCTVTMVSSQFVGYFLGGLCCSRVAPARRYTAVLLAALLSLSFNLLLIGIQVAASSAESLLQAIAAVIWPTGAYWLVLLLGSLIGATVGFRLRDRTAVT